MVTGPSIRLAEVLAQNWGNLDFGIVELEQRFGESSMLAYAWDLETNTRQTKVFTVKHKRRARGADVSLTDPRDIYEMTEEELTGTPMTPASLAEALSALRDDPGFLTAGGVFTDDLIANWIDYKMENEVGPLRLRPHPYEFYLYYDN